MKIKVTVLLLNVALLSACGGGGGGGGEAPAVDFNLTCDNPFNGEILDMAPGAISLSGSLDNVGELSELTVNGLTVDVLESGAFTASIDALWGINFVDMKAVDALGRESNRNCAYLLSDTWAPDTETLSDTISIRTRQASFDDSNRSDALDSFADILHAILNSSGLRNSLHGSLLSANTLKPNACDESVLGVCVLRSEVTYLDTFIGGPNSTTLSLVDGGLSNNTVGRDIRFRVRVKGHISGIPYDTTGWITFSSATTNMIINTTLAGGIPRGTLRSGSVSTSMGTISTSFSGLDGFFIDLVASLFNGTVRNLVVGLINDFLSDSFNDTFDGMISGLDVHNLATTFDVPRIDGATPVPINFATSFTTLNTNTTRMLVSMGTQFDTAPTHVRTTLGAPIPSGTRLLDFSTSSSIANALHIGILDQALHALWRGGYFDGTIVGGQPDGPLPEGAILQIAAGLPPAASLRDDGLIEISLGAVDMRLDYPALVGEPVEGDMGGRLSCTILLVGDILVLENCLLDEQHLSTDRTLSTETMVDLTVLLGEALDFILAKVGNDALPVLPLPGFKLPSSVSTYGLPAGEELGLLNPAMESQGDHAILHGNFGLR